VVANSPAEKAGVRPMLNGTVGDVITTLDDKPIRTGSDIFKLLDKHAAELRIVLVQYHKHVVLKSVEA